MSVKFAILGLLSWKPLTGYEMKKIFEESSFMYWSGNNNQIYKALVELQDDGLATSELQHQEGAPSKKIYTITGEGLAELKEWVLSQPEAPDFKKGFLVQLAWTEQLSDKELSSLLSRYENEVKMQLLLQQEKAKRGIGSPCRSARETCLWGMISDNLVSSYKNELDWIQRVRKTLLEKEINEEGKRMNYNVIEKSNKKYVEILSAEARLSTTQDVLELAALCGESDTNLLMIHADTLSEDFFRLKTGVAGEILQKLVNYRVKAVIVLSAHTQIKNRFSEFIAETNKGKQFGVFSAREEAEKWLLKE